MIFRGLFTRTATQGFSPDLELELGSPSSSLGKANPKPLQRSKSMAFGGSSSLHTEQGAEEDFEGGFFNLDSLDIDMQHILDSLDSHIRFRVKEGYEMKNLPKFHDSVRYNIQEEEESMLWRLETERLSIAAKSADPPSLEADNAWFGAADSDGYNRLHLVALQIKYALDICIHDNELVLLEHHPPLANEKWFGFVHRRICHTFDQDQGCIRYERSLKIDQHNDKAYHALVNYLTAVLIRLLLRSMSGSLWVENCLSTLAKFATKLKVVGADLPRSFEKTLEAYNDFQVRVAEAPDIMGLIRPTQNVSASEDSPLANQHKALLQDEIDTSGFRYFGLMDNFCYGIGFLIQIVVDELSWDEEIEQTADVFETSAIVYDTGFPDRRTLLCHERDGSIGAAAERRIINFTGAAFEVGVDVWDRLSSSRNGQTTNYTTITWSQKPFLNNSKQRKQEPRDQTSELREPIRQVQLTTMSGVITALVPYLMYCGSFTSSLASFAKNAVLISNVTNPVRYYQQHSYVTVARICTSEYQKNRGSDTAPFTQTVFETNITKKAQLGIPNEQLRDELDEMKDWTMDEKSIIIQYWSYSFASLCACGFLIAGGIALIAIQDKAAGLDPSNLTGLAWAAAGFIMVYLKSRRVHDWPWRDFLSGRIVCRSVSEVKSVTGMDPQALIAILLRQDGRSLLKTRGPFNTLFKRRAEDGFSIDVPPLTSTITNGGHIFVRVDSLMGPAMVGLEAKNWEAYDCISPTDRVNEEENFICRDFLDPGQYPVAGRKAKGQIDGDKRLPLYPICTNELGWSRVRGVFSQTALFG